MCRWLAYFGNPIRPEALLYDTQHSLVEQSRRDRLAGGHPNADGFGLGWYGEREMPGLYRSIAPAWGDRNLRELAGQIQSPLFLAHIRAATGTPVEQTNCHPFRHGRWLFVHNGFIDGYLGLRRELLLAVDPRGLPRHRGHDRLRADVPSRAHASACEEEPLAALERMAGFVEETGRRHGVDEPLQMTVAVSDGERLYAARYASGPVVNSLFVTADASAVRALYPGRRAVPATSATRRARSSPSRSATSPACGTRCRPAPRSSSSRARTSGCRSRPAPLSLSGNVTRGDQADPPPGGGTSTAPARAGLVLISLILVAAVANLNLAVANVALPDIGEAFDAGQTELNLVAVGYSLGLAASVLYLGALGDRYGRKLMLILGTALAIPASLLAALAPSIEVLFVARLLGGLAAGMAYPTTLALITALWSGPARTKSIALWSGLGGAIAALGPLLSGALLTEFEWGSVFVITLPLAVVALYLAFRFVPAHVNEATDPVDNLGGILSVAARGGAGAGHQFRARAERGSPGLRAGGDRGRRRRRFRPPPAPGEDRRSTTSTWPGAGSSGSRPARGSSCSARSWARCSSASSSSRTCSATRRSTRGSRSSRRRSFMVLVAPRSAKLVDARGARFTLLVGYAFCLLGFLTMLLLWKEDISYWKVGLGYALIGIGVGFAGTPASHSLTGSVPVKRAGMASGTADLQRDLGGAIMQSILGAVLTAGYASAVGAAIAASPDKDKVTDQVQAELTKSFSSAADTAEQYPQYQDQIVAAAKASFLQGDEWAYIAGIVAILLGAVLIFFQFPKPAREAELLEQYQREDSSVSG